MLGSNKVLVEERILMKRRHYERLVYFIIGIVPRKKIESQIHHWWEVKLLVKFLKKIYILF